MRMAVQAVSQERPGLSEVGGIKMRRKRQQLRFPAPASMSDAWIGFNQHKIAIDGVYQLRGECPDEGHHTRPVGQCPHHQNVVTPSCHEHGQRRLRLTVQYMDTIAAYVGSLREFT